MQKSKKQGSYQRGNFSDEQIYEQIKDQIRQIRESRFHEVQKLERALRLYSERKESKRRRKILERGTDKKLYSYDNKKEQIESESEEPGQINESLPKRKQRETNEHQLTIQELGELIKQVTLTRKRLIEFLDNRKFEDLVKGCFVRYKCDSNSKEESYMIAKIIGVKQGTKEYTLTSKHKTKILLVIQESSIKIVELPIEMISNQAISGSKEINRWVEHNGDKIPKEKQIKEKLQQHNRLLTEQLSSQEIDKNILNRAIALSKGHHQVKSLQDLQNLLDFIIEKYEGYIEEQEVAKRKEDKFELMGIRRKKHEYFEVLESLEQKKKSYLESKGLTNQNDNTKEKDQKIGNQGLKIEEKRQDEIKEKWKLRQMMLCTAEGFEKIRVNLLENHAKFEIELDV